MSIRQPIPKFSKNEKRLLKLMAKLLVESIDPPSMRSNTPCNEAVLTDQEAQELLRLMERLASSPTFINACYFVEGMTQPFSTQENKRLREIYLSQRQKNGRTRAMGYTHWLDFRARAGLLGDEATRSRINPMSFEHFKMMEYKLLHATEIPPQVVEWIMRLVKHQEQNIRMTQEGRMPMKHGTIRQKIIEPILQWGNRANYILEERNISTRRIASAILIITDIGTLFTTRDWGVAGFMSTIAGAAVEARHD